MVNRRNLALAIVLHLQGGIAARFLMTVDVRVAETIAVAVREAMENQATVNTEDGIRLILGANVGMAKAQDEIVVVVIGMTGEETRVDLVVTTEIVADIREGQGETTDVTPGTMVVDAMIGATTGAMVVDEMIGGETPVTTVGQGETIAVAVVDVTTGVVTHEDRAGTIVEAIQEARDVTIEAVVRVALAEMIVEEDHEIEAGVEMTAEVLQNAGV